MDYGYFYGRENKIVKILEKMGSKNDTEVAAFKNKKMNGFNSGHLSQQIYNKSGLAIFGQKTTNSTVFLNWDIAKIWALKYLMIRKRTDLLEKLKKSVKDMKIKTLVMKLIGKNILIELIIGCSKL